MSGFGRAAERCEGGEGWFGDKGADRRDGKSAGGGVVGRGEGGLDGDLDLEPPRELTGRLPRRG